MVCRGKRWDFIVNKSGTCQRHSLLCQSDGERMRKFIQAQCNSDCSGFWLMDRDDAEKNGWDEKERQCVAAQPEAGK